jgi:hypothetical protein
MIRSIGISRRSLLRSGAAAMAVSILVPILLDWRRARQGMAGR